MMTYTRILAIDTATGIQALALVDGDTQVARRHHTTRGNHADTLLHNIHDMLTQQRWSIEDLDLVACGLGPGSFTGLRVGLANAKALAVSAGAVVAGVSTLAAIARPVAALTSEPIVSVVDARRLEMYVGVYQMIDGTFHNVLPDVAVGPEEFLSLLDRFPNAVVVGSGHHPYVSTEQLPKAVTVLHSGWDSPSPFSLATLTRAAVLTSGPPDIVALEPNYIRPSDAEANLKARLAT
ncbi:MAG: tRNA (adenosine(37)-N6)-threonylcarbamoyltransferase complex dimerization subunit type 1 TsaB [bacterium]